GRIHVACSRSGHHALCTQQTSRDYEHCPGGEDCAVHARCDISRRIDIRPAAEWALVDGLHRTARLRRISCRRTRVRQIDATVADTGPKLGAYRTVKREAVRARWTTGVPESKKADLIPEGWFEACADANFASDPVGAGFVPPVLRAPNGVLADARDSWNAGKP